MFSLMESDISQSTLSLLSSQQEVQKTNEIFSATDKQPILLITCVWC